MEKYNHSKIEKKWQERWRESGIYRAVEEKEKPKSYVLDMFPYPSGEGLHVGHPKGYIATDIYSRFKRMNGHAVLHPMGWDAFGLPAENFAIQNKVHPRKAVEKNIARFKEQLEVIGFDYDWEREINTTDPEYYKWTQWIFLKLFEKGLAYQSNEPINWCPSCMTGLANEDLEDGACERCGTPVEQKRLPQWVLKITDYADRLVDDLEELPDWPDSIKESQRNWIGRSEGARIKFKVKSRKSKGKCDVLLLHGLGGRGNQGWFLEVKTELEQKGYSVCSPNFPKSDTPLYREWEAFFEEEVLPKVDEQTIVIAHSLGPTFLIKYLSGKSLRLGKAYFVAPAVKKNPEIPQIDEFFEGFDLPAVRRQLKDITVLYSNDPYIPEKDFEYLITNLGARGVFADGREHFTQGNDSNPDLRQPLAKEVPRKASDEPKEIEVFTTRPDTLFGATYMVLAPEHPLVEQMKDSIENWDEVSRYIQGAAKKTEIERTAEGKEKTGVRLEGVSAINPATNEEIPVFVADYVLAHYGTGAIMAVPAHDERDFEFAKKFDLPIRQVVAQETGEKRENEEERHGGCGVIFDPKSQKYAVWKSDKRGGLWGLCSGGVDEGEDLHEGIRREVEEESGLHDFQHIEEIDTAYTHYYNNGKKVNRAAWATCCLFILGSAAEKERQLDEHEEDFEIIWASPEEIFDNWNERNEGKDLDHWIFFLKKAVSRAVELGYDTTNSTYPAEDRVYVGPGVLINSGKFDDLDNEEAKQKITEFVGGEMTTTYRLRDWVFSRQRYWGEPIPIIHCQKCGAVPVPEEELPVTLPEVEEYEPSGTGESPLATIDEWVNTECPKCGGAGKRETNTMPQWAGSSWYYLRYMDPHNDEQLVAPEKEQYWAPVDVYVGGAEHATRHLIYARFWHKFLFDSGVVSTNEPFMELHSVGLIQAEDGRKMSKRFGNVVNPDDIVEEHGADALRLYEMFMGPFENAIAWDTKSLKGVRRFIERIWRFAGSVEEGAIEELEQPLHQVIKKVSEDIPAFKFNTAISQMMIFLNAAEDVGTVGAGQWRTFLRILAPFAPHVAEELWERSGGEGSVHTNAWPEYDPEKARAETVTIAVQVDGKVRGEFEAPAEIDENTAKQRALESDAAQKWLAGKEPTRVIYVPGKLVNIVV